MHGLDLAQVEAEESDSSSSSTSSDEGRNKASRGGKAHEGLVKIYMPMKKSHRKKVKDAEAKLPAHKRKKEQTVESILKAASDAKVTAEALNKKGKELGEVAKAKRATYEAKAKEAQDVAREAHEFNAKSKEIKARLTRVVRRLETLRHEAVHEASLQAKVDVKKQKTEHKELVDKAKEEARAAAEKEGASATMAIGAAQAAHKENGLAETEGGEEQSSQGRQAIVENDDDWTDDE